MIELLPMNGGDVVAVRGRGKLTHADYEDVLLPRLYQALREHGAARLLCVLGHDFDGITPAATRDDLKFDASHRRDFTRIAVVTDDRWVRVAMGISRPFFGGEMRVYALSELGDAEAWIGEGRRQG